jgi:hypothetical protein
MGKKFDNVMANVDVNKEYALEEALQVVKEIIYT